MDEIIYLCIDYWNSKGAVFTNSGTSAQVTMNGDTEWFWFSDNPYYLHHRDKWKSLNAFQEISKSPKHKALWQEKCRNDLENILEVDEKQFYDVTVNTQVLDRHVNDVSNFLDSHKILKISSPMATRKSNIIDETIKQSHERNKSVLIITNRISLANDIADKYNKYNIKHYQQRSYEHGDSLVVQFDSLLNYNPEAFDVVILDEVTSLLLYMTSTYLGKEDRYHQNLNFFSKLHDKQFLISDSFIIYFPFTGKTLGIYNEFRETLKVVEYSNKKNFEAKIIREAKRGLVSLSSNEKRLLVTVKEKLERRGMKVLMLTGDTENKEEVYSILSQEKIDYDAILYSPTLTVGVSILSEIQHHFHFDNSGTITVIDSIQMTRRVRNARDMHYYIKGRSSYKDVNIKSIELKLTGFQMMNKWGESFGLTNTGKILSKLKQMNNIFRNTHKYAFRELLLYQFEKIEYNNITLK